MSDFKVLLGHIRSFLYFIIYCTVAIGGFSGVHKKNHSES